jgi:hypothetical protein
MSLSQELQTGKAGEHLVCFDLITQGYNAFLADQGLPFDVVVENNGSLLRIQVKTTQSVHDYGMSKNVYRFGTRKGKGSRTRTNAACVDYYAFVAMDIKTIAYLPIAQLLTRTSTIKQTIEFKTYSKTYKGRRYSNGTIRDCQWGKYIEEFSTFSP